MRKFNPTWLPYAAAFAQAVLFSFAGQKYFGDFGWLVGLFVGMVVSLSLAVASSRISDISQKRQPLARLILAMMMLLSPATVALSFFAPSSVFTAISWAASPDIAVVLAGAIAGKSLVKQDDPQKSAEAKPTKRKVRSAEIICRHAGAGCGRKFASQNAANAHARSCGFKPTIAMPVYVSKK